MSDQTEKNLFRIAPMAKALSEHFKTKIQPQLINQAVIQGRLKGYFVDGIRHVDVAETIAWYQNRGKRGNRTNNQWKEQAKGSYQRRVEGLEEVRLGKGRKFVWDFKGGDELHHEFNIKRHFRVKIDFVIPTYTAPEYEDTRQLNNRLVVDGTDRSWLKGGMKVEVGPTIEFNEEHRKQEELTIKQGLERALDALTKAKVPAKITEDKKEMDQYTWFIRFDQMVGGTVTSPPIRGLRGLKQVAYVMVALQAGGVEVDDEKGSFHVYIDITDFDVNRMRRLFILYHYFEHVIDDFMPVTRRRNNNKLLRSLRVGYFGEIAKADSFMKVIRVMRLEQGKFISDQRYKLNPSDIFRLGVVEFKHQGSTFNKKRMHMWIRTCMAFVEESARIKFSEIRDLTPSFDLFTRYLYLDGDIEEYWHKERERIAQEIHDRTREKKAREQKLNSQYTEWMDSWLEDPDLTHEHIETAYKEVGYDDREAGAKADVMIARIKMAHRRLQAIKALGAVAETEEEEED
jgi:hypothetical protein